MEFQVSETNLVYAAGQNLLCKPDFDFRKVSVVGSFALVNK